MPLMASLIRHLVMPCQLMERSYGLLRMATKMWLQMLRSYALMVQSSLVVQQKQISVPVMSVLHWRCLMRMAPRRHQLQKHLFYKQVKLMVWQCSLMARWLPWGEQRVMYLHVMCLQLRAMKLMGN